MNVVLTFIYIYLINELLCSAETTVNLIRRLVFIMNTVCVLCEVGTQTMI